MDSIIIDCEKELKAFRKVVCELDMPTIDMDAALSQVFETVRDLSRFENKICYVASDMAFGDALFENSELEADARDRIHEAVVNLGENIKKQLILLKAYEEDGTFPFSFGTLINDSTIVLKTADPF